MSVDRFISFIESLLRPQPVEVEVVRAPRRGEVEAALAALLRGRR